MALPSDAGAAARRAFSKSRSTPKPKPRRWSPSPDFHTEAQDHARTVVTQKKLRRATAPLKEPSPAKQQAAGPEGAHVREFNHKRIVSDWRKHVRDVIKAHDQDPKGLRVAAKLLQNEADQAHDQLRLHGAALDHSRDPSTRLAAARELRVRYGIPMSTHELVGPDRMKRVAAFLKETDRNIARDSGGSKAGTAATMTFNPLQVSRFLHTVGALSTEGAAQVTEGIFGRGGWRPLGNDTPKVLSKIGTNTLKDLLDLPAQSVVSAVDIGNAAVQAGRAARPGHKGEGSYAPAKQILESTKHLLAHPTEHPLAAALVLKGGIRGADAAAGTALRTATRGKVAGTGGRAPIELYGKHAVERSYTTGLVGNAVQRALDAKRPGAALHNKFARPVRDAKRELAAAENHRGAVAHPTEDLRQVADRITDARRTLEGRKVGKHEALPMLRDYHLGKRVDEAVDTANARRSAEVIRVRKELRADLPRKLRPALRPVLEGTIKSAETAVGDIRSEIARLKREHSKMQADKEPRWRVRRNERQQHVYERLLENKAFLEDPHPVFAAADKFIESQRGLESKLAEHGLLDPERALRSKVIPFAVRELGARFDPATERILGEDGAPLTTSRIISEAVANGVRFDGSNGRIEPKLGFISQRGDLGRLGDYFKDPTRQPQGYFQKRTGESALKGLHKLNFKMVEAQLSHTVNVLAQAEHANEILDRFGMKPKGDIAFTDFKVASNAATQMSDKTGMSWQAVRIGQAVGEQLRAVHEHIDPASVEMLPEAAQLPGKPTWLVMPSTVAKRFQDHANSMGSNAFQLGFQALTHQFRNTVLPLSPRWLAGNIVELVVRGAVAGTGPMAWAVGHSTLKRVHHLDEGKYDALVARATPGAHYASQVRLDRYQGIERWADQGFATHFAKPLFYALHHNASPLKHLSWVYGKYTHAVKWITPRIEMEFQKAALGKEVLHEIRDMNGHWLNALPHWNKAIDDVSHGLLETNKQLQFAAQVDKVVGRYNKLSPSVRNLVSGYAPFALWYANALKFVFVTMPHDHPIIQGWIAAGYVDTEKKRLTEGKSLTYSSKDGPDRMPDFLQGTLTQGGGHHLPLQRYTPFGAFSDPEGWQGIALPQISSLGLGIAGKDWKMDDLKGADGKDLTSLQKRLAIGMYSAFEATLPGLAVARRVREQGGSSYSDSTAFSPKTRPDTKHGYLGDRGSIRKVLDPFQSYAPGSKAGTGGTYKLNRAPRLGGSKRSGPKLGTGSAPGGVRLG